MSDRKGQISRNKVDGHVQNWSCHLMTGGTTNRLLTDNIKCGDVSEVQVTPHTTPDAIARTIDRTIDRLWLPLVVRSSPIVVDRATTRTTNRTMTYPQQERPIVANIADR